MNSLVRAFLAGCLAVALLNFARAVALCPPEVLGPPLFMELPQFTALVYDEDFSYLKNPAARTNAFDAVKYIPVGTRGNSYLTLGGQVRDRYENFPNDRFGSELQDKTGYNLLRVLASADLH